MGVMWDNQCFKRFRDFDDSILCLFLCHSFLFENQGKHHKETGRLFFDTSSLVPGSVVASEVDTAKRLKRRRRGPMGR